MTDQLIVVEYGNPYVANSFPTMGANRLAVLARTWEQVHVFDGESHFTVQPRETPSFSFLTKFLAHTIYNPSVSLEFEWHRHAEYRKSDLVELVEQGLQHDDDIIQQWFGADDVLALLNSASSWEQLLIAVRAICGDHEVDTVVRQYVAKVLKDRRKPSRN